jgi:hypothetical protein
MSGDPFAPARRALVIGPALMVVGGALIVFGIAGSGLAWLLCVLGGLVALFGLLRLVGGIAVLAIEGRRREILREGEASTAVVNSAKQVGTRSGYPIFEMGLRVRAPDGSEPIISRKGAIPPQAAGSLAPGTELPIKIRRSDNEFAVDWDSF